MENLYKNMRDTVYLMVGSVAVMLIVYWFFGR
jgi:hypothetical protein